MIYISRQLLLTIFFLLLFVGVNAQITSTFNSNVEGWTAPNALGNTISHVATGGNPGGYVTATPTFVPASIIPPFPVYFNFIAPAAFLGNFSSYYNGNITYDLRQNSSLPAIAQPEVVITNGSTTIYYYPPTPFNPPTTSWATYSVPLSASSGNWKTTNSSTGPAATQPQIISVLTSITGFGIRGRFNTALLPGPTSLDNVVMQPPISITTQPNSQTVCAGTNVTLSTAATGNNNLTYQWQLFNISTGAGTDLINNAVYSGVTSNMLNINTSTLSGTLNYRCRVSGTNAVTVNTNPAAVTVNSLPGAPSTTGGSNCGSGSVSLSASGGSAGQYRWYTVASGGTAIPGQTNSTYNTPVLSATTNYYVALNNGTCESNRTLVIATINTPPLAPSTTGAAACGASSVALSASGGSAGQYRWYTVSSGGTAIPGQTNSTYNTPVLSVTTNYYVAINNGTCESNRTLVVATINTPPLAPSTTGAAACGASSVALS
ncbi:MAG: laminin B domain-containing protein, partial [Gammaproteobacteria bacterium]